MGSSPKVLVTQYKNFVSGVVGHAKPMLIYAQRMTELEAIQAAMHDVSYSLDLNRVLDEVLRIATQVIGFQMASISLIDQVAGLICGVRSTNELPEWQKLSIHSLHSNDIHADIVRTGKREVLKVWDDRFDYRIWHQLRHSDRVSAFVPIDVIDDACKRRPIGTLLAQHNLTDRSDIDDHQMRMLDVLAKRAGILIEQARTLRKLHEKTTVLEALHRASQAFASIRNPEALIDEIGREAKRILQANLVMLYRYDSRSDRLESPHIYGEMNPASRLNLDLHGNDILNLLLKGSEPYYSHDAQHDSDLIRAAGGLTKNKVKSNRTFIQINNIKSFAAMPLVTKGKTIGIMFVNYFSQQHFDSHLKEIHELFAQQSAAALENLKTAEYEKDLIVREEKNRLSRELHLTRTQHFIGIAYMAHNALKLTCDTDVRLRDDLGTIEEVAQQANAETGFIIDDLRAPPEESSDLAIALDSYIDRIKRWYKIPVITYIEIPEKLESSVIHVLVHIAREALHNAVRHSQCASISVHCRKNGSTISLVVQDDGKGFDPDKISSERLGLVIMKELAAQIGANIAIDSKNGSGTTISVTIDSLSIGGRNA